MKEGVVPNQELVEIEDENKLPLNPITEDADTEEVKTDDLNANEVDLDTLKEVNENKENGQKNV